MLSTRDTRIVALWLETHESYLDLLRQQLTLANWVSSALRLSMLSRKTKDNAFGRYRARRNTSLTKTA